MANEFNCWPLVSSAGNISLIHLQPFFVSLAAGSNLNGVERLLLKARIEYQLIQIICNVTVRILVCFVSYYIVTVKLAWSQQHGTDSH